MSSQKSAVILSISVFAFIVFVNVFGKKPEPVKADLPPVRSSVPAPKSMTDAEILEEIARLEGLSGVGTFEYKKMRELYAMLAKSNKTIKMYAQMVAELDAKIAVGEAQDAVEEAEFAAEDQARKDRDSSIKRQFSGWDGSHIAFTTMIKAMMKNPDSYKHIETKWWTHKDYIYVETTYRGTNSFGAVVPATSGARFTINGNFLGLGRG